jgi:hypothetical protein
MRSLTRYQRGLVLMTAVTVWLLCSNPMLLSVGVGCAYRTFTRDRQPERDDGGLLQLAGLMAAFTIAVMLTAGVAAAGRPY